MKIKLLSKSLIPFIYHSAGGKEFELMMHGLEFTNGSDCAIELQHLALTLADKGGEIQTQYLSKSKLRKEVKESGSSFNSALNFSETLSIWLSKRIRPSSPCATTPRLERGERAIIGNHFFHLKNIIPTKLIVEVSYLHKGQTLCARRSFSLKEYQQKNDYILPLKGNIWALLGPATGSSHHRQTASQEFAYDSLLWDQIVSLGK